jgi:phosphoribosylaminoimidazole carboxylase (NCAIR synthetase)
VHLYGKSARPNRKLGHVTALADSVEQARAIAQTAADLLSHSTTTTTMAMAMATTTAAHTPGVPQ